MPSILFNNENDPAKNRANLPENKTEGQANEQPRENIPVTGIPVTDFAIFPEWDVLPPNAIINPRLKKKI
jgi:hypothetical protein